MRGSNVRCLLWNQSRGLEICETPKPRERPQMRDIVSVKFSSETRKKKRNLECLICFFNWTQRHYFSRFKPDPTVTIISSRSQDISDNIFHNCARRIKEPSVKIRRKCKELVLAWNRSSRADDFESGSDHLCHERTSRHTHDQFKADARQVDFFLPIGRRRFHAKINENE